jgi:hypothetical protein
MTKSCASWRGARADQVRSAAPTTWGQRAPPDGPAVFLPLNETGSCSIPAACRRGSWPGTTTDAGEPGGGRPEPSADQRRQLDDDVLWAAEVAELRELAPPAETSGHLAVAAVNGTFGALPRAVQSPISLWPLNQQTARSQSSSKSGSRSQSRSRASS